MNIYKVDSPRPTCRGRVIALHCSGAGASQWCYFAEVLGGTYEVLAPEHYGRGTSRPWIGEHAFTLADEVARVIALIDRSEEKVHLVGHSYGGGIALHVALARPGRIASMALYEPSAFHLLRQVGEPGAEAYAEIAGFARRICHGVVTGHYRSAVASFVDYWNGASGGAERADPLGAQGALEFRALIDNPTPETSGTCVSGPMCPAPSTTINRFVGSSHTRPSAITRVGRSLA
jgi:pimeloyl-ACP methyl ester carboxylesterase